MEVEKELALQQIEDEKISNKYVMRTIHIVAGLVIIFELLNEVGFFYIDKPLFRGCTIVVVAMALILQSISKNQKILASGILKYLIMIYIILITLMNTVLLSFHATLMVFFPLVASTHYHSSRISLIGIIGTCFCAFVSPLLSYWLNTFDISFLVYLLKIASPENLAHSDKIDALLKANNFNSIYGLIVFYSLPHFMLALGYAVLAFTVNRSQNASQKARVTEMKVIQDNILYSVADLIENRDSNTGTHVKRTSEVVRILVHELEKNNKKYSAYYWNSIIKSAPMHDLGKIAVPDSILKKPGRLTQEEFETIKMHSQKSADIIEQILGKIEDKDFLSVAENIARYHHERFDGSGYPCKLKGNEIPYEARIMAIADVFDALVSQRCYKESKTPEEAYSIIKEGMGTHFDPNLFETFDACFPKLKEYYISEN